MLCSVIVSTDIAFILSLLSVTVTLSLGRPHGSYMDAEKHVNQRDLARIGSKLSHDLKVQLVHSNILCFIDYCNSVYYGITEKNLHKLQKIQNNAARFIFGLYGKKIREPIMPYLKKLHFLPVRFRIKFKISLLVFKCLNNIAPQYLQGHINLREVRRRSSRLDDDFYLLKVPPAPHFRRTDAAFIVEALTGIFCSIRQGLHIHLSRRIFDRRID